MSVAPRYTPAELHSAKVPAQVKSMPQKTPLPLWLKFLLMLQHSSFVFACCTIVSALGVYGWTVYTPRLWNQEYKKLIALQRHERNLTATNETLKNELARQAERPEAGLVTPNPEQMIILPAASNDQKEVVTKTEKPTIAPPAKTPLAY